MEDLTAAAAAIKTGSEIKCKAAAAKAPTRAAMQLGFSAAAALMLAMKPIPTPLNAALTGATSSSEDFLSD
jgi:hypothetical protein